MTKTSRNFLLILKRVTVIIGIFILLSSGSTYIHAEDNSVETELNLENYLAPEASIDIKTTNIENEEIDSYITDLNISEVKEPKIEKLQPKEITADGPEFRLRIHGQNFKEGAKVSINGIDAPTFYVNSKNLLTLVSENLVAQPGAVTVNAINPDGLTSKPEVLTINASSDAVKITRLKPDIVLAESTDFALSIFGDGFTKKSSVRIGGRKTKIKIKKTGKEGLIFAAVSSREVAESGTVPIQVEVNDETSKIFNLIIAALPPKLEDIEPGKLELNSSDTTIKIKGKNFSEKAIVLINGQEVKSDYKSDKRIDAIVPASLLKETKLLEVIVSIPGEGTSDTVPIAVAADEPVIFELSPTRIIAGESAFKLHINGANLNKDKKKTKVLIDGKSANITSANGRELIVKIGKQKVKTPTTIQVIVQIDNKNSNTASLVVESSNNVSTLAGNAPGFRNGIGEKALFTRPSRATQGPNGLIYIADQLNHSIRQFDPSTGSVTTIAGDGTPGYVDTEDINTSDSNKNNDKVRFNNPLGIAVDSSGAIYVSDFGNDVIRKITKELGSITVSTYAGKKSKRKEDDSSFEENIGIAGFKDGAPTDEAKFSGPDGIVATPDGTLYIADSFNNLIRVISSPALPELPKVTSLFGNRFPGFADGKGPLVRFNTPTGLAINDGNLFVADFKNNRIRKVDLSSLTVTTLTGIAGSGNIDGSRLSAKLNGPIGIAIQGDKFFVVDNLSDRIRRVENNGEITTIAGKTGDFADGSGPKARFRTPRGIITLSDTELLLVDQGNHRLRKVQ